MKTFQRSMMALVLGLGLISTQQASAIDPQITQSQSSQAPQRLGFQGVYNGMGMRVVSIQPGSLAQINGIEVSDVVTQVNGWNVTSYSRYLQLIQPALAQGNCTLTVRDHRTGQFVTLQINVGCAAV